AGMGLWLSMVVKPKVPQAEYPMLAFAAALAAADAVRVAAGVDARIKWPNDLLFGGRKLAGILAEKEGGAAVIGIGVNVRQKKEDFPPELRESAVSLEMITGKPVSPDALERALFSELERRIEGWNFMREYASRCDTIGKAVRVAEADKEYAGVAEGLDALGALLVRDQQGALRRVLAGDVSVRM
ncbi:MAG: biotin--[acetyl-CoA-carboxylase] ligase, partial [Firmicutes bacterium]|nr:biotin--[acetyl-CoA-carboxylase] ligase [Bacillota bacterium]